MIKPRTRVIAISAAQQLGVVGSLVGGTTRLVKAISVSSRASLCSSQQTSSDHHRAQQGLGTSGSAARGRGHMSFTSCFKLRWRLGKRFKNEQGETFHTHFSRFGAECRNIQNKPNGNNSN